MGGRRTPKIYIDYARARTDLTYYLEVMLKTGEVPMPKSATVWIDPQTRMIAIRTAAFDQFFNNTLKALLQPPASRRFDPTRKVWLADQCHMEKLQKIFVQCGYEVQDGTLPQESAPSNHDSPFGAMLEDVPIETLRKVYRVIALDCHPDKHPERRDEFTSLMMKVNVAWAKVQEEKRCQS